VIGAKRKIGVSNQSNVINATYLSLPPPLSSPHLVVSTSCALLIRKHLLAPICYIITKGRIPYELPDALYRITDPKLIIFSEELAVFIL
jgi:hypothetical protein